MTPAPWYIQKVEHMDLRLFTRLPQISSTLDIDWMC